MVNSVVFPCSSFINIIFYYRVQSNNTAKQWMTPSIWENYIQLYIAVIYSSGFQVLSGSHVTEHSRQNVGFNITVKPKFNFHVSLAEFIKPLGRSTATSSYLCFPIALRRSWAESLPLTTLEKPKSTGAEQPPGSVPSELGRSWLVRCSDAQPQFSTSEPILLASWLSGDKDHKTWWGCWWEWQQYCCWCRRAMMVII